MGTTIRARISPNNKYWISKHRYYELKHFCLQYKYWLECYLYFNDSGVKSPMISDTPKGTDVSDPTAKRAVMAAYYADRIYMVKRAACDTDEAIGSYILKAVTEGLSYTQLKTKYDIPCSKDMYYDRYRKFFYILNKLRE